MGFDARKSCSCFAMRSMCSSMWLWDIVGSSFLGECGGLWILFERYLSHLLREMQDGVGRGSGVSL